jgi:hypothetical protein
MEDKETSSASIGIRKERQPPLWPFGFRGHSLPGREACFAFFLAEVRGLVYKNVCGLLRHDPLNLWPKGLLVQCALIRLCLLIIYLATVPGLCPEMRTVSN